MSGYFLLPPYPIIAMTY